MNYKNLALPILALFFPLIANAQSAIEALQFSQPDMKGTARFMSMGGAFGALGGDLSSLSQNPGGIGVYRSNDIGFTLDLDCQSTTATSRGSQSNVDQTKFLLNNIGGIFTLKLNSSIVPNLNFGFTYNKSASFNRKYAGSIPQLNTSMSNYIAGLTNDDGYGYPYTEADMTNTSTFNPYFPNDNGPAAPWLSILGYDSYLITPQYKPSDDTKEDPDWMGQWGDRTSGGGYFSVEESGSIDSYNIAFGGNISNIVYWGMDFDIINFNFNKNMTWGENLNDAYVEMGNSGIQAVSSNWNLNNSYSCSGTGFNYKLGIIVKPIQELRLGVAFHTPTWYNMSEQYIAWTNYRYAGAQQYSTQYTNYGTPATTDFNYRSPWRLIASAAGVIGGRFIISFDYEWQGMKKQRFSEPSYGYSYWDGGYDWRNDWDYPYFAQQQNYNYIEDYSGYATTNNDIRSYCTNTNTYRIGAEYRVTNNLSVRAGYSYVSSPISSDALNNKEIIYTTDYNPSYRFDRQTNYVTCGFGWRSSNFYVDAAYVYKNMKSTFHAFTADPLSMTDVSPTSELSFNNSQIVLSMGVRF